MDQVKIGKFIKQKRKEKKITQSELAEKLNVTDRAISKWENGICMPDSGIIAELCKNLNITINDLFSGEVVDMKDSEKRLEKNLIEIIKLKEQKDKQLLSLEIFIGILVSIILFACAINLLIARESTKCFTINIFSSVIAVTFILSFQPIIPFIY